MEVYIGLDVSLASTAVCVLGDRGKIVSEAQVSSGYWYSPPAQTAMPMPDLVSSSWSRRKGRPWI